MRELKESDTIGLAAVGTVVGLVVLVASVGAIGLWARYVNTWQSFFLMEQVVGAAIPITLALLAGLFVAATVLIARSR